MEIRGRYGSHFDYTKVRENETSLFNMPLYVNVYIRNAYPYFQMLNKTNILSIRSHVLHIITKMIGKMLSMSIHSLKLFGLVIRGISKWTRPTQYGN